MITRLIVRSLFAVVVFTVVFLLVCSYAFHVPSLYRISTQPGIVYGTVTDKHTEERGGLVSYRFDVGHQAYQAKGGVGDRFATTQIGDTVQVRYDQKNPEISTPGDNSDEDLKSVLLISGVFSLIGGIMFGVPIVIFLSCIKRPSRPAL